MLWCAGMRSPTLVLASWLVFQNGNIKIFQFSWFVMHQLILKSMDKMIGTFFLNQYILKTAVMMSPIFPSQVSIEKAWLALHTNTREKWNLLLELKEQEDFLQYKFFGNAIKDYFKMIVHGHWSSDKVQCSKEDHAQWTCIGIFMYPLFVDMKIKPNSTT